MPGIESRRAGADGHEQRILQVAELLAGLLLEGGDAGLHLRLQRGRIGALVGVVIGADLGRDGEAGGHRQADAAHLGEVGALAAEQRLHGAVAVGLLAEEVDDFGAAHALRDVLDALEQRRHAQERLGSAHLRERLELLAPSTTSKPLEIGRHDRADVPHVEPALLEQVNHAFSEKRIQRLLRRPRAAPHGSRGRETTSPERRCRRSRPSAPAGPRESSPRPAPDAGGRADRASRSAARPPRTCRPPSRACRPARRPPTSPPRRPAAAATAARRLPRRSAGSGSRSPSRRPRAALLRARRCRPSCPAAR